MLVRTVKKFLQAHGLVRGGDSILVAVSGGRDSVALLHVLAELGPQMDFRLACAHLNHGLRGRDASADARFVKALAARLGMPCTVKRVDTAAFARRTRLSLEEAARELRRDFLIKTARSGGHSRVALGHTKEDQAETVLLRLIRGAGVLGLAAMRPLMDGFFIRPFLGTSRAELEEFLEQRGITYREDASNIDITFMRNRIRHELLELLKAQYNPAIVDVLGTHASLLALVEDYLGPVVARAYDDCATGEAVRNIELERARLVSYHCLVQSYVLREAYRRVRGSLRDLSFRHVASLVRLISSGQSGDSVDLPSGVSGWLEGEKLWIGKSRVLESTRREAPFFSHTVRLAKRLAVPQVGLVVETRVLTKEEVDQVVGHMEGAPQRRATSGVSGQMERPRVTPGMSHPGDAGRKDTEHEVFFDLEKLHLPLTFRNPRPGDRMVPFGMKGTKKIQDLLVDLKVPRSRRRNLALLCDRDGILWVVGVRRAQRARISPRTCRILRVNASFAENVPAGTMTKRNPASGTPMKRTQTAGSSRKAQSEFHKVIPRARRRKQSNA